MSDRSRRVSGGPAHRLLNEVRLRRLLKGVRDGDDLPAIHVYRAPGAPMAVLVQGAHRWRVSLALGFLMIPCWLLSSDEAADYGLV